MYCSRTDIEAYIRPTSLASMTDDGVEGGEEVEGGEDGVLSRIMAAASSVVDSYLSAVVETPMSAPPAWISQAAAIIACEMLYARMEIPAEQNPFSRLANQQRVRLEAIAAGKENFVSDGAPGASAIATPAKTHIENSFML